MAVGGYNAPQPHTTEMVARLHHSTFRLALPLYPATVLPCQHPPHEEPPLPDLSPQETLFPLTDIENQTLTLADRFTLPPFTVLDTRSGQWQSRKRQWLDLGIASQAGRQSKEMDTWAGAHHGGTTDVSRKILAVTGGGASVFDPVLTELAYRWFTPEHGTILDPFAGGSVRGIVAGVLGRHYTGIDLRDEQVDANYEQSERIGSLNRYPEDVFPNWVTGDSIEVTDRKSDEHVMLPVPSGGFDFIFSCPPYFDLERYSKDPLDLSNMKWPAFVDAYRKIIRQSVELLAPNRFAAFVVGEVRNRTDGTYRGFMPETIRAFEDAGAAYWNEAILVTPVITLAVRTSRPFVRSRKLGRCHQSVLVFVKGDPKLAAKDCDPDVMGWTGTAGFEGDDTDDSDPANVLHDGDLFDEGEL